MNMKCSEWPKIPVIKRRRISVFCKTEEIDKYRLRNWSPGMSHIRDRLVLLFWIAVVQWELRLLAMLCIYWSDIKDWCHKWKQNLHRQLHCPVTNSCDTFQIEIIEFSTLLIFSSCIIYKLEIKKQKLRVYFAVHCFVWLFCWPYLSCSNLERGKKTKVPCFGTFGTWENFWIKNMFYTSTVYWLKMLCM